MNLRHIEIFHAIMRSGSISSASRRLNVSQPNVTRVLAHAEQQLGFALFERRSQGLIPTPEALRLWPEIEQVMQQLDTIDELTRRLRRGDGQHLRIGAAHALGQAVMPEAMITARVRMPKLTLELVTSHFATLCDDLLNYRMDVALAFAQQVPDGIRQDVLCRAAMVALVPKGMAAPYPVSLAWLRERDLLLMQRHDPLGTILHHALADAGLSTLSDYQIKTYSVIADMVLAGAGVGIVDAFTAARYSERLQVVPLVPALTFDVVLLHPRHSPLSHTAQQFRDILCQRLASTEVTMLEQP
ncbi:LysR family transcriptional regulator [Phytohalomonas tamaricis]|uniref:LysR family transcriptional regulator n=1 Tax=Phytohalomonas tamaricis TaxID=2081032 RepID=UPI000D0B7724|nr:LysR family transcriptional regulator [Phytohalomonas tamaricis]